MTPHIPRDQKMILIKQLAAFWEEEHGIELGDLAAETAFDFMRRLIEPYIYNQAVAEARSLATQRAAQLEDDLYALEKPIRQIDR